MKAIYEIKFFDKRTPKTCTDSRRIVRDASTKGFKQVVAWADSVCEATEFVGSVVLTNCEHL
jgi:hypothetical protein